MTMDYQVKLEVFEGPFDLLLTLISGQKLDICDIPIAKITEEYLTYLQKMRDLDLEVASEFLLVAATLLEIKAQSLLPVEEEEWEEEVSLGESREALILRLLEYKKFKNAALELAARLGAEGKFYPREADLEERFAKLLPDFLKEVGPAELAALITSLLARGEKVLIESEHISSMPIGIDEKMDFVMKRLRKKGSQSFRELTTRCKEKIEAAAIFLALLELYKMGLISLSQAVVFGDIEVRLSA